MDLYSLISDTDLLNKTQSLDRKSNLHLTINLSTYSIKSQEWNQGRI